MRKTLTATALLLALSCPTLAGIIHTPGSPEPPDDAQETTTTNEGTTGAADTLIQTALTVLASLLP
jgi:hypothetical protein